MVDAQTNPEAPEVVVGVDGTETTLRAVTWAATEARLRGMPLRLLHAAPYATPTNKAGQRRATAILARAYTVAHQHEPHVPAHTQQVDQQPVRALVDSSDNADLIVVRALGERFGEVLIGSVALAVSGAARCPVTVVRGRLYAPFAVEPVLLGLEDAAADAPAITAAFADAQRHRTRLIVLHARRGSLQARITGRDAQAPAEEVLAEQLAPWRSRYPMVPVDIRVMQGGPADELLLAAATARLVVVGTHGRGAPARLILGSTSRALVRHSPCPVTVVRWDTMVDEAQATHSASATPTGPSTPSQATHPHDRGR